MQIKAGGHGWDVDLRAAPPPRRVAVLVHGLAGSRAEWEHVQPVFLKDTSTATLDLLGHGASDAPDDPKAYTFDAVADALRDLADALGAQAPFWVGYSMGARLLLYLAIRHPSRVGGLILESAHAGLADAQAREARAGQDRADAQLLETRGLQPFFEQWHARPVFDSQRRRTQAWRADVDRRLKTNKPKALAQTLRGLGLGSMPPLHRRLGEIKAPTLLLAGTLDAPYMEEARSIAKHIPGAEFKPVLNAGHAIHRENPEGYAEVVRDWLDTQYALNPARGL